MKSINGRGRAARTWVEVLEKLTLRRGLRFLTMLTWQNVLTAKSLLRTVRAWCPRCLEEQRESGEIVYEQLLWTLNTVDACFHHRTRLETTCPRCGKQIPPYAYGFRPGHCSQCRGWLGHPGSAKAAAHETEDLKYQLWVANQMGELIGEAPNQSYDPPRERLTTIVPTFIKRTAGGNTTAFADMVGIDKISIYLWLHRNYVPTTDLMLKICHRIGVSFSDIVTKEDVFSDTDLSKSRQALDQGASVIVRYDEDTLKDRLLAALEEDPPPSLQEVADRLGYTRTSSLRGRCPELTKLLTSKHRAAFPLRRKIRDSAVVKLALQRALKAELPPSVDEIARSLGYAEARSLLQFRRLYDAILIRRAEYKTKYRNGVRLKLKATMLENHPPTLKQVAKRVGYRSTAGLSALDPELSRAISMRHATYRKKQIESLHHDLQSILCEEPPLCLRATASRLGKPCDYLREKYPRECHAIVKRYARFFRKTVKERKARAKVTVRHLALDLGAKGIYPSHTQLRRASNGPIGLDCLEVTAAVNDIRRELISLKRGNRF